MTEDEIEKRVTALHAQCAAEPDMVRRYELREQIAPLEKQLDAFRLVRARKFLADMDARRAATAATSAATSPAAMPAASVTPSPSPPAPSAAEIAQRRQAASRDLWRRVIGKVNAEMFGSEPDASRTDASRGAPSDTGQKPDTKSIWSKAVAKANAEMTGNEACQPPSNGRSGEFLSKSMATAGKRLEQAGFKVT